MNQPRNLVIALDGSDPSFDALDEARDLARAMGRELSALYVYPHHRGVSATPAGLDEQTSRENLERMKEDKAKEIFSEAESRLGNAFAHRYVLTGDPAEEIIAFMEGNPGTHLVMGRRGLSKIKSLLMGSVSSKIAAHAPGLVTVV
ncbi:universal stress protein [Wenzhouxiangella sediminis]|uniref:Universal stress protein n=1 Tax=Wenzhouxiangella sediminis TaxID=1792836 RepID=A0A3E1K9R2_9GAMM|nr:universal stress protein [Wenzhouxiangella sediminis]RFF30934.1 universal stress protein [Wenzhouxiangella sediminis]